MAKSFRLISASTYKRTEPAKCFTARALFDLYSAENDSKFSHVSAPICRTRKFQLNQRTSRKRSSFRNRKHQIEGSVLVTHRFLTQIHPGNLHS